MIAVQRGYRRPVPRMRHQIVVSYDESLMYRFMAEADDYVCYVPFGVHLITPRM